MTTGNSVSGDFLVASGLTKVFDGGIRAVDGVDLQIRSGEIFALLGPNGAGKTTTIRMIVTLARPTSGTVILEDIDVVKVPDSARERIGYVGQEVALDRSLTAREHLELQAGLYHIPPSMQAERIGEILDLVELTDRADDQVRTFSGGMKKRLDLACGLIHRPRLLVLDEPTLGLDIQTRTRIWQFIRTLREQGTTILLTTHYLEEADQLCDRIAIMDHGKIQTCGTPAELKTSVGGDVVTLTLVEDDARPELEQLAADLRGLPFIRDVVATDRMLIYIEPGQDSVPKVFKSLTDRGVHVDRFTYSPPSLDDVFLKFTGHSLRD